LRSDCAINRQGQLSSTLTLVQPKAIWFSLSVRNPKKINL
jgi:hypothetical protein